MSYRTSKIPAPFKRVAAEWTSIMNAGLALNYNIAKCFPIKGWTGSAATEFTEYVHGAILPDLETFTRIAGFMARILTNIANYLEGFLRYAIVLIAAGALALVALNVATMFGGALVIAAAFAALFFRDFRQYHSLANNDADSIRKTIIPAAGDLVAMTKPTG
jgi:hypothetical protein